MCRKVSSCVLNIVIALIFGAIAGILFGFGFLTGTTGLIGAFVVGIVGLVLAALYAGLSCFSNCARRCCDDKICLILGSVGAVATSLISVSLVGVGVVIGAILAALTAFFTALVLISIISIVFGAFDCDR